MAHRLSRFFEGATTADAADRVDYGDMDTADKDEFVALFYGSEDLSDAEFADVLGTTPEVIAELRRYSWSRPGGGSGLQAGQRIGA